MINAKRVCRLRWAIGVLMSIAGRLDALGSYFLGARLYLADRQLGSSSL